MSQPPAALKFNLPVTGTRWWEIGGCRKPWAELQEIFRELQCGSGWTSDLITDLRKPWMWDLCPLWALVGTNSGQIGNKGMVILTGSGSCPREGSDLLLAPLSQPPLRGNCQRCEGKVRKGIYKANTNWDWAVFEGVEKSCKEKNTNLAVGWK